MTFYAYFMHFRLLNLVWVDTRSMSSSLSYIIPIISISLPLVFLKGQTQSTVSTLRHPHPGAGFLSGLQPRGYRWHISKKPPGYFCYQGHTIPFSHSPLTTFRRCNGATSSHTFADGVAQHVAMAAKHPVTVETPVHCVQSTSRQNHVMSPV